MKGRMIHHVDGRQESQLYDPIQGQVRHPFRPVATGALTLDLTL